MSFKNWIKKHKYKIALAGGLIGGGIYLGRRQIASAGRSIGKLYLGKHNIPQNFQTIQYHKPEDYPAPFRITEAQQPYIETNIKRFETLLRIIEKQMKNKQISGSLAQSYITMLQKTPPMIKYSLPSDMTNLYFKLYNQLSTLASQDYDSEYSDG